MRFERRIPPQEQPELRSPWRSGWRHRLLTFGGILLIFLLSLALSTVIASIDLY